MFLFVYMHSYSKKVGILCERFPFFLYYMPICLILQPAHQFLVIMNAYCSVWTVESVSLSCNRQLLQYYVAVKKQKEN
jgi:hypothetical protein